MNTTVATLVRILDEERNERQTAMADLNSLRYNLTSMERQYQSELDENRQLRADIRDINVQVRQRDGQIAELKDQVNVHLQIFSSSERMREAIERLVFEFLPDEVVNLTNEHSEHHRLGETPWIPIIRSVREKFGLTLKTAKDLVDSYRAKVDGLCPTCNRGEGHTLVGHFPDGGCSVKFCNCREW